MLTRINGSGLGLGRYARPAVNETPTAWGCWGRSWSVATSGGITQVRQRLGYEPLKALFSEVAALWRRS